MTISAILTARAPHLSFGLILALSIAGCSPDAGAAYTEAAPAVPPAGAVPQSSLISQDAIPRTYDDACGNCHNNGGFGVRVLADRLGPDGALIHNQTSVPAAAIRQIVRNGFGAMPAMSKIEISDAELDGIIDELISERPASEGQPAGGSQ